MKIVLGNKIKELESTEFLAMTSNFKEIVVDIGTGDGRFVYKGAKSNPKTLYIGVDPSEKQLQVYSKKTVKEKIENCLFVLGAIENLPQELTNIADELHIIFPWGSLLKAIATTDESILRRLRNIVKIKGIIQIIFGYDINEEPTEFERLGLSEIDTENIKLGFKKAFLLSPQDVIEIKLILRNTLKQIESTWGKKLRFNPKRNIYHVYIKYM